MKTEALEICTYRRITPAVWTEMKTNKEVLSQYFFNYEKTVVNMDVIW